MVYRRFHTGIVTLSILLALVSYAFAWSVNQDYKLVTSAGLGLVWVSLIVYLIHHVNRVNRDLGRFVMSIHFDDMSNLFDTERADKSHRPLYDAFNKVILAFRDLRIQKEKEQLLFRSVVEQTGAGIIVLDQEGSIVVSNRAFNDLFGVRSMTHLDQLQQKHPEGYRSICGLRPGKQQLLDIRSTHPKDFIPDHEKQVILVAGEMFVGEQKLKVVTLQNIRNEMEQNEMDAWERMLRIVSHEITNSVSPVNLLASSLIQTYEQDGKAILPEAIDQLMIDRTLLGLKTIRKRGQGLIDFVDSYRAITNLPEPFLKDLVVKDLYHGIINLFKPDIERYGILTETSITPEDLKVRADETLLEQALINLFKNAVQACGDQPEKAIRLEAFRHEGSPVLTVTDNGPGIPAGVLENIFTPFFSGREGGSGIGLSFARQVMKIHHGNIGVRSNPGSGSTFTLSF